VEDEQIAAALEQALTGHSGSDVRIEGLRRLSSGASRQSFEFTAVSRGEPGGVGLILQAGHKPSASSDLSSLGALSITGEGRLIEAAARAGVPVPEVVASGGIDGPMGRPFLVTVRLPGEALPTRLFRDPAYTSGVARLTSDAADALARIHDISPEGKGLPEGDQLAHERIVLDLLKETRPILEHTYRWLGERRPLTEARGVVHGDFRLGNLLVDPTGLRAVLDWELAHLGDPLEDVAWPMIRAWRFDRVRPPEVFPERESWVAAYEAASGRAVDREALSWWEVALTFRWAVICLVQAHRHLDGLTPSLELAVIGRRVFECEWDLLCLLGATEGLPEPAEPAAERQQDSDLHGTSTKAVLVEAVRDMLASGIVAPPSGSARHQVRVAANALAIVARELDLGPDQEEAHRQRLASLGVESDADLAGAIRQGAFDGHDGLMEVLASDARDRLLVANPAWLAN
jgi:aminoglycoside phosphotransferase (APT) family kinase protein